MDPLSMMKVPEQLMSDTIGHLSNPVEAGQPVAELGKEAQEWMVRSVLLTAAEWLAEDNVQAELGKYLDDFLTNVPILPSDPYERRMHLQSIVEAVGHMLGVR